jgi:hypothetical protein
MFPSAPLQLPATSASAKAIHFAGMTRNLAGRHWLSPEGLDKLLKNTDSPYLGQIPAPLRTAAPQNPGQLLKALDQLTPILKALQKPAYTLTVEIVPQGQRCQLAWVGEGSYGKAYRLTVEGVDYLLKIYKPYGTVSCYGSFGEAASGTYFSKTSFNDLSRFYLANPQAGWALFEFIGADANVASRPGRSIRSQPVELEDDEARNLINGIRVDYGGIRKKQPNSADSIASVLRSRFQTPLSPLPSTASPGPLSENVAPLLPSAATKATTVLHWNEDRYLQALETGQLTCQLEAVTQIPYLEPAFQPRAIQLALACDNRDLSIAAAQMIPKMSSALQPTLVSLLMSSEHEAAQRQLLQNAQSLTPQAALKACKLALVSKYPSTHMAAAHALDVLPDTMRFAAFQWILSSPYPSAQLLALSKLEQLPETIRYRAFTQGLQSDVPKRLEQTAALLPFLPEADRFLASQACLETRNETVIQLITQDLSLYPKAVRYTLFEQAFDSGNPTIKEQLASQINLLPDGCQWKAYQSAFSTDNPAIQQAAAKCICLMPSIHQPTAYRQAMATAHNGVQLAALSSFPYLPGRFQEEAFRMASQSHAPDVRAEAMRYLPEMPKSLQPQALRDFLTCRKEAGDLAALTRVSINLPTDSSTLAL